VSIDELIASSWLTVQEIRYYCIQFIVIDHDQRFLNVDKRNSVAPIRKRVDMDLQPIGNQLPLKPETAHIDNSVHVDVSPWTPRSRHSSG
jgi:hypothetical protein